MTMQLTHTGFVVRDAIPLPAPGTTVRAAAQRSDAYAVRITTAFEPALDALSALVADRSVAILTDETVEALYAPALVRRLRAAGADPLVRAVPPGEGSKSLRRACGLWDWLASSELARRDVLLNFGGGVIADLGGWVASAYMRGLPYVNMPTTLLAQVDGALGGKVAVNHPSAKNLLGAFHQPIGVVANVGFLQSTSARHMRAGLAEAIKKAVIASPELWSFIDERAEAILGGDLEALERLVCAAAAIKTELIARDPYEADLRRPLNYGHTVGHPVETLSAYDGSVLHGEAVAFGMVVETRIAAARGWTEPWLLEGVIDLLRRCRLPTRAADLRTALEGRALVAAMEKVRQIRAGSLRYVLPVALGETVIADDVTEAELVAALEASGVAMR
jgi:3-dehydroquinate synthase